MILSEETKKLTLELIEEIIQDTEEENKAERILNICNLVYEPYIFRKDINTLFNLKI